MKITSVGGIHDKKIIGSIADDLMDHITDMLCLSKKVRDRYMDERGFYFFFGNDDKPLHSLLFQVEYNLRLLFLIAEQIAIGDYEDESGMVLEDPQSEAKK